MKKIAIILICIIMFPNFSRATPLEFAGGVQNEYQYEEYVFVTGKPVKFAGSYSVSEKVKDDEETITYKFKLNSVEGEEASLDRTISYKTNLSKHTGVGQVIGQTTVDKYKESIKFGKDKYDLEDYQFSKSDIIDQRAASDFYSGNIKARKYYKYNKDQGTIIIDITGGNVGYENFWGSTETNIIDNIITSTIKPEEGQPVTWQGTYSYQVSDSMTKSLRYSENDPILSSFHGGHIRVTNQSIVSKYDYNMKGIKKTISLNGEMMPRIERLIVPKFRDVNGHWAENNIKKLYSLDVFEENSDIFSPDTAMNRLNFTKAIMRASDIRTSMEDGNKSRRRRDEEPKDSYFSDISIDHPDYQYVKGGVDKKIIVGISKTEFGPDKPLSRAEAITVLIRALGFENRAPNPGYITSFSDDKKIPAWAKDSIYMARELDILQGDPAGRVNPSQALTRAEASTLIVRFLEFLEKDLQRDYRENILNY